MSDTHEYERHRKLFAARRRAANEEESASIHVMARRLKEAMRQWDEENKKEV